LEVTWCLTSLVPVKSWKLLRAFPPTREDDFHAGPKTSTKAATAAAKEIENTYFERFSHRIYDFFGDGSIFGNQTDERAFLHVMRRYSMFPLNDTLILNVGRWA